jgi:hypothetical protein
LFGFSFQKKEFKHLPKPQLETTNVCKSQTTDRTTRTSGELEWMVMGFIIIQRDSNICESVSVCVYGGGSWGGEVDSKTSPWGATEEEEEEEEEVVVVVVGVRGGSGGTVDRNS